MLSSLIGLFVLGVVVLSMMGAVVAVIALAVGMAIGTASWLLLHVVPVVLVGWAGLKLVSRWRSGRGISAADQRWLDS